MNRPDQTALLAAIGRWHGGDRGGAAQQIARIAAQTGEALAEALQRFMLDGSSEQVYASPAGFADFIGGGGNVALYRQTSAALAAFLRRRQGGRLVDIGTGDGRALVPALGRWQGQVTCIEPSAALAETLQARTPMARVHRQTLGQFLAQHGDERFDAAVATFSLQSIEPAQRAEQLRWLAGRARALAVVEFDALPTESPLPPPVAAEILARYRRGVAEYPRGSLAVQAFLMPVLLGYFASGTARTNWEQSAESWRHDLRAAGFSHVRGRKLHGYWWADAWLFTARGSP